MGRHSASRVSLPSVLSTAARRGTHGALRAVPRVRRSAFGVGAAAAAVALTATTAAAALSDGSAAAGTTATGTATTAWPTTSPTTGTATLGTPVVSADPATVEAASDVLVRAQFVTSEGSAALTPEQVTQIEQTRTRLSEAVAAAGATTDGTGLSDTTTLTTVEPAPAADAESAEPETGTETETETETAGTVTGILGADTTSLAERGDDRASRSAARSSLTDLTAPLPALTGGTADEQAETQEADATTVATDDAATAPGTAPADPADATTATGSEAATDAGAATDAAAQTTASDEAAPAPTTEEIAALTAELSTLLEATRSGVAVQVVPGPPSAEEIAVQLDQWAASTAGYGNGEIPSTALCELSFAPGEQLRCDAAHQIEALNVKYREAFGVNLSVTDSYRSYSSQVAVKASRGYFAAPPGWSNHGWALALDLGGGIQSYGTAQYEWMRANAPAYGFDNPEWARAGGSKNEPWHWEYGDIS